MWSASLVGVALQLKHVIESNLIRLSQSCITVTFTVTVIKTVVYMSITGWSTSFIKMGITYGYQGI